MIMYMCICVGVCACDGVCLMRLEAFDALDWELHVAMNCLCGYLELKSLLQTKHA